jgi:F-type H+-transporting ATPase subunit delta
MSVSGSVARRYARALLNIGLESNKLRPLLTEIERVSDTISQNDELRDVLANPMVLPSQRKNVLDAVIKRLGVTKNTRNLCMLLIERQRISVLSDIARELRVMVDDHEGMVRAEVISAAPLSKIYLDKLSQSLAKATGKKIELTTKQDESLIGGVVTRVGGVVYDGSLKTRVARVREEMLR